MLKTSHIYPYLCNSLRNSLNLLTCCCVIFTGIALKSSFRPTSNEKIFRVVNRISLLASSEVTSNSDKQCYFYHFNRTAMIAHCYSILLPFKHIDYFIRLVLKVCDVLLTLVSKILFISKYSEPYFIVTFTHKCKEYYSHH